jgi:tetratricopeptide (TPR) repeat protein
MYLSEFRDSGDAFARAAEHAGEPSRRAVDLVNASHSYVWAHAGEPARRTADAALALARAAGHREAEAHALSMIGFRRGVLGEIGAYAEHLQEAWRLVEPAPGAEIAGLLHFLVAEISEWRGDYELSLAHGERALAIGRKLGLAHLLIWSNWFLGKAACCRGDYGRALGLLEEGRGLTERIGDRAWNTRLLNTLGWCYAEIGDLERARASNQGAARVAREIGDAEIIANAEINLALNHLALGEATRAREGLAALLAEPPPEFPFMHWRYSMHLEDALGRVALAQGDPAQALAGAEREIEASRRHAAPKLEARALELRARALLELERPEDALAALDEALAIAGRIGYPRATWRGLGLAALLERRAGRRDRAEACEARRAQVVEALARSLPDADLRRGLLAAGESAAS